MKANMHRNPEHLSQDQIDEVLIGDATADTSTHLQACGECRERVAMAAQPMASFAAVTLAWSERQSATMAAHPIKNGATAGQHRWNWALAAAVLLVAGLLLPLSKRDAHRGSNLAANIATPAATTSVTEPQANPEPVTEPAVTPRATLRTVAAVRASSAEVARDNQMLAAIHDELDASIQSPVDAFGLPATMDRPGGGHGQNVPAPSLD